MKIWLRSTFGIPSCVCHDLNVMLENKVGKEQTIILTLDVDSNRVILNHCKSYILYEESRLKTEDFISYDFYAENRL
jgi:hypothetical protein